MGCFSKKATVLLIITVMLAGVLSTVYAAEGAGLDWEDLEKQGICNYGTHEFQEGLMPVLTDNGWNYINESGNIVDLNKGRFSYVYPFFEGLAAVIDFEDKAGYIDISGEIVIPCQFESCELHGSVYTGYFNNGAAPILKVESSAAFNEDYSSDQNTIFIGKVDKKGSIIQEYKQVNLWEGKYNVISDSGHDLGKEDIQASDWAQPEIDKAKEAGLLTDSIGFLFTSDITRGQFAELVVNMSEKVIGKEISPAPDTTFTDSKDTSVLKAYRAKIVSGISDTAFEPETLITREQIATMLYRAITYIETEKGKEYSIKNDSIDSYSDKGRVSSWAKTGVGILANNGIMKGTSDTALSPKGNATIEQCVIFVYRLYNIVNK